MSDPDVNLEPDPTDEAPPQGFADFESALESLHSDGLDESFENLALYFSVPGRESEVGMLFADLDFHSQIRFIQMLMAEVFEGVSHHHQPSMIVYRKRISEGLRITKGEVGLEGALSEARIGRPDAAISYFRANPSRIHVLLGKLGNEYPDEAKAVTLSLVEHLLKKLQASSG